MILLPSIDHADKDRESWYEMLIELRSYEQAYDGQM